MSLAGRTAIVHGGGGAIGGAIARELAQGGAALFLAGRTSAKLRAVADDIAAAGGTADIAEVDALDAAAVARHAEAVVARTGRIDIAVNAIGLHHVQGPPLADLSVEDFIHPVTAYLTANFAVAKAVAPQMRRQGSGVIITLSTPGSRLAGSGFLGFGVTCGAIETFSRLLAAELGASGVRVVCLRPDAIPETLATSHARAVFEGFARQAGMPVETMLEERARRAALLGRSPTLAEVAGAAAFVASDRAGAMTGAIVNLTCGVVVD